MAGSTAFEPVSTQSASDQIQDRGSTVSTSFPSDEARRYLRTKGLLVIPSSILLGFGAGATGGLLFFSVGDSPLFGSAMLSGIPALVGFSLALVGLAGFFLLPLGGLLWGGSLVYRAKRASAEEFCGLLAKDRALSIAAAAFAFVYLAVWIVLWLKLDPASLGMLDLLLAGWMVGILLVGRLLYSWSPRSIWSLWVVFAGSVLLGLGFSAHVIAMSDAFSSVLETEPTYTVFLGFFVAFFLSVVSIARFRKVDRS